jgi:hypothetical protein
MNKDDLLPMKMNALIFTYIAALPFVISQDFIEISLLQIIGIGVLVVVLENLWNISRGTPVMDERKQEILTNGMAWSYIAVTLSLIATVGTGIELDTAVIEGTIEFGIWIFIICLSLNLLYQNFGAEKDE